VGYNIRYRIAVRVVQAAVCGGRHRPLNLSFVDQGRGGRRMWGGITIRLGFA
jgi:hypothetical protein